MKEWLLSKSNIRNTKGLTIGLIILIILATSFLNIMLIIFTDFSKNAEKNAQKLNSEDAFILFNGNTAQIDENYIESIINEKVENYEVVRTYGISTDTSYGDGTVTAFVVLENGEQAFNCKIGKSEIAQEDTNISSEYIYLPYQYNTGGKYNTGDDFELKILDKVYKFKIKGFINNIVTGSYNCGTINVVVDDDTYNKIVENTQETLKSVWVKFDLKQGVDETKFIDEIVKKVSKNDISLMYATLEGALYGRTFISVVLGASFLFISSIILIVVFLMMENNISNYLKENIKSLGAIKAIGYTGKDIRHAFILQFLVIAIIGSVVGISLSYLMLPSIINIMTLQIGIPYTITFNTLSALITMVSFMIVIILTVLFGIRKINKIKPITALREGIETHNFKKNRIELEKTRLPINMSFALKTMVTNIKQNIATFVIVFFLVFAGVTALVMYQNFSYEPKISLLAFEICDGAICTDSDSDKAVYNYIESLDGVKNTRLISNVNIETDNGRLYTDFMEDTDKLNNKDVCYKGRLPKYDNEIAVSGKYCKKYNFDIGDEIEVGRGDIKEKCVITGFIQTTNNNGQEAVMLKNGIEKIIGTNYEKLYYFDVDEGTDVNKCIEEVKEKFGDRISLTVDFEEVMKGSISVFKSIANAIVAIVMIISGLIILLVLYLLIKTLIVNKKKDYGILKALGYTSKNIIVQNAISFMPSIILSVITSCIVSCFIVNPFFTLMMSMFGVMKVTFNIPVVMVIFMGIVFVILSFIFALMLSLKIRKIEPYNLLRGE